MDESMLQAVSTPIIQLLTAINVDTSTLQAYVANTAQAVIAAYTQARMQDAPKRYLKRQQMALLQI